MKGSWRGVHTREGFCKMGTLRHGGEECHLVIDYTISSWKSWEETGPIIHAEKTEGKPQHCKRPGTECMSLVHTDPGSIFSTRSTIRWKSRKAVHRWLWSLVLGNKIIKCADQVSLSPGLSVRWPWTSALPQATFNCWAVCLWNLKNHHFPEHKQPRLCLSLMRGPLPGLPSHLTEPLPWFCFLRQKESNFPFPCRKGEQTNSPPNVCRRVASLDSFS